VSAAYSDPGIGGAPRFAKPQLDIAIAALRTGSVLLMVRADRLSRDWNERDARLAQVKAFGARVIGVEDSFDSSNELSLAFGNRDMRAARM